MGRRGQLGQCGQAPLGQSPRALPGIFHAVSEDLGPPSTLLWHLPEDSIHQLLVLKQITGCKNDEATHLVLEAPRAAAPHRLLHRTAGGVGRQPPQG